MAIVVLPRMALGISRRSLLAIAPTFCLSSGLAAAAGRIKPTGPGIPIGFPAQDPELVRDTVGKSHSDLSRVRELVGRSPALVNASWDWGFGDWETAIGAASHTGQREIAEFLLANGARPDIFTFVMLGQLEAVQAAIQAQPGLQRTCGPHGITMLAHARDGGDEAAEVLRYLQSLGDADQRAASLPMTDAEKDTYLGEYRHTPGEAGVIKVALDKRGDLTVRAGISSVKVHRVEAHGFAPSGAPAVRIRFKVEGDKAVELTVHDPEPLVTAVRV